MTAPAMTLRPRSRAPALLALFFGLLAGLLTFAYISQLDKEETGGTAALAESANLVPVVVADQLIPIGATITEEMLRPIQVPDSLLVTGALTDPLDAVGKVARFPLQPGQQVVAANLSELSTEASLSFSVPAGHRAMAVQVDEVVAVGGFVRPGDFVDVVVTYDVNGVDVSYLAAQDVEVLAVAQTRPLELLPAATEEGAGGTGTEPGTERLLPQGEPETEALSVTLALTPEEAVRVFLGDNKRDKKNIRLLLRPFGDHETQEMEPFFFSLSEAALAGAGALPEELE